MLRWVVNPHVVEFPLDLPLNVSSCSVEGLRPVESLEALLGGQIIKLDLVDEILKTFFLNAGTIEVWDEGIREVIPVVVDRINNTFIIRDILAGNVHWTLRMRSDIAVLKIPVSAMLIVVPVSIHSILQIIEVDVVRKVQNLSLSLDVVILIQIVIVVVISRELEILLSENNSHTSKQEEGSQRDFHNSRINKL